MEHDLHAASLRTSRLEMRLTSASKIQKNIFKHRDMHHMCKTLGKSDQTDVERRTNAAATDAFTAIMVNAHTPFSNRA